MEELTELRNHIQQGRYQDALVLIGEMDEMSRDDKINKIESFLQVLLAHLIKQSAEKRTTRSWDISISNAIDAIGRVNKRRRAGGFYLDEQELWLSIEEIYPSALRAASLEVLEGRLDERELSEKVTEGEIKQKALFLVSNAMDRGRDTRRLQ